MKGIQLHVGRSRSKIKKKINSCYRSFLQFDLSFLYIDGSHSYEHMKFDTPKSFVCVKSGGVVIWHNWGCSSAIKYLEQLSNKFGASFEQICHRLTTLNRPGARGIAFFFLRVDEAGHISKRLSGGGVEFAKYGGSCSRWIPHQAFRTPEQIQVQFAELEDAHRLITITKTVSKPRTEPPYILSLIHI